VYETSALSGLNRTEVQAFLRILDERNALKKKKRISPVTEARGVLAEIQRIYRELRRRELSASDAVKRRSA